MWARKKRRNGEFMSNKILSQINASVLVNAVYAMQGYPAMLISNILSPISIIIIVSFVSHGALVGIAVAGALMTLFVSGGLSIQADLAHLKNDFKFQDMIVSSPTSAWIYLLGMAVSELIFIVPSLIVLLILAFLFLHATLFASLVIVAVLALMYIFATVFGFFLSTITTDILQSWAFTGILSVLLTAIPPVYYPITYIPLPWRYIAYISPTTYAAGIVQNALGYLPLSQTVLALYWTIIIVLSLILFAVALKKNRWRDV
jgi:ABC-2 type transport system permease protein